MNNLLSTILLIVGGALFILSPNIGNLNPQPSSQLEKSIKSSLPLGSTSDMRIMANTLRLLANTISITPEIEVDDASLMLKKSFNWSYNKQFDFKNDYPETFEIISKWYEDNAEKVTDRQTLVEKWRELAEALD